MESNFQESQFVVLFPWKTILHWQDVRVERVNFVFLKGLLTKKITYLKLFKCCHFRIKRERYSKRIYIANMPSLQFKLKKNRKQKTPPQSAMFVFRRRDKVVPRSQCKSWQERLANFQDKVWRRVKRFSSTIVLGIGLLHRPGSRERHLMVAFANQLSILSKIQALPGEVVVVWHKSHARLSFINARTWWSKTCWWRCTVISRCKRDGTSY